jgi:hypothetical protein
VSECVSERARVNAMLPVAVAGTAAVAEEEEAAASKRWRVARALTRQVRGAASSSE